MGRAIDLLITYRVIKMLVTPFESTEAYKLGIIDKNGKVLRKARTLSTAKEKDNYTLLHRFVFNLKRLINFIPGGKSKLGTYAAALGLLLKTSLKPYELIFACFLSEKPTVFVIRIMGSPKGKL